MALLLALGAAAAASLSTTTNTVGAASTPVPRCATAGVGVVQNFSAGNVVSVTLSNLDPVCQGGTVSLTVNAAGVTGSGTGVVPASGPLTITISPSVAFAGNAEVDLAIAGP
ncbi:MAG TPA: hypothetical protein VI316_09690 [Candidatus Dormibacteraeota bacterium]